MLIEFINAFLEFIDWGVKAERLLMDSGQRVVLKGWSEDDECACVIKLSKYSDPNNISRYQREIKILKTLDSQYFPKIFHHAFCSPDTFDDFKDELVAAKNTDILEYIKSARIRSFYLNTEEYIDHIPWTVFSEELAQDENKFRHFFYHCFMALNVLWQKRIAHRDIKPDNILVRPTDARPVIIDLGIAKSLNPNTANLTVGHTPHTRQFASPEQIFNAAEEIDYKTDQFSIGVVMFYVLTGSYPYGESNASGFYQKLRLGKPAKLAQLCPDTSLHIIEIVLKLLERHPHNRFRKVETIFKKLGV